MLKKEASRGISVDYLNATFGDQFRYISPWVMARNMLRFAPSEQAHNPLHRNFTRTKSLIGKNEYGFTTTLWLEREFDHAETVYLRGFTQIGDYQSPFSISITEEGAFDVSGRVEGTNERHLVTMLYRFMTPDDPNLPID